MNQALPDSFTRALKPAQRLNCAATAKLVRKALKEAFPEIKFSVRSNTYAGGASIRVGWTDGPLTRQVDPVIGVFAHATFDGMRDLKEYKDQSLDGVITSFGADFVFSHREISKARIEALESVIAAAPRDMWLTIAVKAGHPSPCAAEQHACNARDLAWQLLANCGGETFEGRRSATADSVLTVNDPRH